MGMQVADVLRWVRGRTTNDDYVLCNIVSLHVWHGADELLLRRELLVPLVLVVPQRARQVEAAVNAPVLRDLAA